VATHALNKHLVLVGFMGAGKTTIGQEVARRLGREFVDLDRLIESARGQRIPEIFADYGEADFRRFEAASAEAQLDSRAPIVLALGGGAVETPEIRERLSDAFTVLLDVDVDTAWERMSGSDRPLAQDEAEFRARFERRVPLYAEVADARAQDVDDVVLAAAGVHVEVGALALLGDLVPVDRVALVTEPHVAGIYGADAQLALGAKLAETHELPGGESAKSIQEAERLWRALRIGRDDTIVALGGGALTDAVGFVAATYTRGCPWVPMPTTLVGQVDAAIGGKTAIDIPEGKNLVGAFHWPTRTVIDPALLETLPADERLNGMAEVVKTGLLVGEPLWELSDAELVRRSAAFKAGVCLEDPHDRGVRRTLNLGHTFAHALEAAAGYELPHGRAVALGLLAALRLSGRPTDAVEEVLRPEPARVDPDRAWDALLRDKKGPLRLILLGEDGAFETTAPEADVRAALGELVAG
jgi:3-dehydroquinate synthase/shikimate kinase/3-dehydroquinate synthase